MHALHRLWFAYKSSKSEANIEKMEHYARAIQEVQEDIGLKTTSFPHLGIYGDQLTLYDHSTREIKVRSYVDHSELKAHLELEEEKKKLEKIVPFIQLETVVEKEKGEVLVTITDEIPHPPKYRIKHPNRMHYSKKRDYEWICEKCDEIVPPNKNHICERKEKVGHIITFSDEIPFREG